MPLEAGFHVIATIAVVAIEKVERPYDYLFLYDCYDDYGCNDR